MLTSDSHRAFDEYAGRYDAWYDSSMGQALLATEVECLRPLLERFPRPYLEVGVGTGRFARALAVDYGIDPSLSALELAGRGGGLVALGVGERLPFRGRSAGALLVAFTLCFVQYPLATLGEAWRVLRDGGGLVLGLLLKGTPWADEYARRGDQGHPLYRWARFYTRQEVLAMLKESGFSIVAYRSALFQPPGRDVYYVEPSAEGYVAGAGFVGIAAVKS